MYQGLIPSLLIGFRESLEAALIIVIIGVYLRKIGQQKLNRYLYIGTTLAVAASILFGALIQIIYGGLGGPSEQLFEGIASITATVVLTYMIIWMAKNAQKIKGELQQKIDIVITKGQMYGIATLAFLAVFREGIETVLFLTVSFFSDPLGSAIGILIGFSLVGVIAFLIMRGTYKLDIGKFFKYTSIILIIFAAGLMGYGTHELIEAGESAGLEFGIFGEKPFNINPQINIDGTYPLFHEKGVVGSILKALIGYDGNPEWLRIGVYVGYWLIMGNYILKTYRKGRIKSENGKK
jgi:high-affinity iron transporter